jgi:ABC-type polysaccharide/polyol phosphate transport system ATPase subunit
MRGTFALLKGGVGIQPNLTGRENIFHAGICLGLSPAEISSIRDEIIEFSELEDAIDRPVKYYSDGMRSRLVFSIATSVSPDILMLDELLSAGDVGFRDKASRRMDEFMERSKAVVVVTHGLEYVRERCNKALYLSKGHQMYYGSPEMAVSRYLDEMGMTMHQAAATQIDGEGHAEGVMFDE